MFAHFAPTLFVIGYMAAALVVYYVLNRAAFRDHARNQMVTDKQRERFALFPDPELLEQLQRDTNAWHEKAITAKTRYEMAGVAACAGAPALITLHAVEP